MATPKMSLGMSLGMSLEMTLEMSPGMFLVVSYAVRI